MNAATPMNAAQTKAYMDAWLTKGEVASMADCSERTIDRMMRRGLLKAFKWGPAKQSNVRFRRGDVLKALDAYRDEKVGMESSGDSARW